MRTKCSRRRLSDFRSVSQTNLTTCSIPQEYFTRNSFASRGDFMLAKLTAFLENPADTSRSLYKKAIAPRAHAVRADEAETPDSMRDKVARSEFRGDVFAVLVKPAGAIVRSDSIRASFVTRRPTSAAAERSHHTAQCPSCVHDPRRLGGARRRSSRSPRLAWCSSVARTPR